MLINITILLIINTIKFNKIKKIIVFNILFKKGGVKCIYFFFKNKVIRMQSLNGKVHLLYKVYPSIA